MKIKAFLIAIVAIFIFAIASIGQTPDPLNENFDFYTRGEYRTGVPRPQSILRYDVGDHSPTYAQMERVHRRDRKIAPDRVKMV
ncbi:MAG: hypothetical protein IPP63_08685 [Chloracidobacterium sp.]|nr:hypothetical protein [Chloracidobacterium sp.]